MGDRDQSGRSRWVVPIAVAVIAAVGTVLAAVLPLLFSDDDDGGSAETGRSTAKPPGTALTAPATVPPLSAETPESAEIPRSGLGLLTTLSVDLDEKSDRTGGDKINDLLRSDSALLTTGNARFAPAPAGRAPDPGTCRAAIDANGLTSIDKSQIGNGSNVCIRTSAGRIGVVTLDVVRRFGPEERLSSIQFSYVLWAS